MGTRKTSVLVEVDDHIYDTIVLPNKQSRTFTKLLETLIVGYAENSYIQSYVEGTLDGLEKESMSALDDALSGMRSGLSAMGIISDEIESVVLTGKDTFNGDTEGAIKSKKDTDYVTRGEFSEIKSMLSKLLESVSGGSTFTGKVDNVNEELSYKEFTDSYTDLDTDFEDPFASSLENIIIEEETTVEGSSQVDDSTILDMLEGNMLEF